MLQKNCRIKKDNGIKFYERDLLFDDYIFASNIEVSADVTYITPGFGIALIDSTEGASLDAAPSCYLFKAGYREISVYYSSVSGLQLIKQISCMEAATIQQDMNFKLKKNGKKISIYINNVMVLNETINKTLDKFYIGYYSNSGNTIKNINIASNIPDKWIVNMKNTAGGYIRFLEDSFEISECKNNAEIEQTKITLKPGTYYLQADKTEINNKCDIKCYIYKSDDDRYLDEDKNILNEENSFVLYDKTDVNLKITGTSGKISGIILSNDKDADYIPTSVDSIDFDGSYIEILNDNLLKAEWRAVVKKTPYKDDNKADYYIIKDNVVKIRPEECSIKLGKEYKFEFNFKTCIFSITDNEKEIYSSRLVNITDRITIFKNLSAIISELVLYNKNNDVIDIVKQDTSINFVNANISSPIIVIDDYEIPLDLSSSYRFCHYDGYDKYVFTNWEREYFYPEKTLKLEKQPINNQDSIIVYGIRKADGINLDKIYDVKEDNINSIDCLTKDYVLIKESDLMLFDKNKAIIYLKDSDLSKYEMFIVDYLKNNSYAINYNYIKNIYEIDISSSSKTKVLYDSISINSNEKIVTQIENYKITNINGNIKGYVVLGQGDEQ